MTAMSSAPFLALRPARHAKAPDLRLWRLVWGWLGTHAGDPGAAQAHESYAVYSGALSPREHKSLRRPS